MSGPEDEDYSRPILPGNTSLSTVEAVDGGQD
jgi:hypothetical protein